MQKRIKIDTRASLDYLDEVRIVNVNIGIENLDGASFDGKYFIAAIAKDNTFVLASTVGFIGISKKGTGGVETYHFTRDELELVAHDEVSYNVAEGYVLLKEDKEIVINMTQSNNEKFSDGSSSAVGYPIYKKGLLSKITGSDLDYDIIPRNYVYREDVQNIIFVVIDGVEYVQVATEHIIGTY